jgi:ppGpp synthetase/RelA/SpoT-type nucleotidyltranferase
MKPVPFTADSYIKWHEAEVPSDAPLGDKLSSHMGNLKTVARDDLGLLYNVLTSMFTYASNEIEAAKHVAVTYQTPLQQALLTSPGSGTSYDGLFKSNESIINKMWRKANDKPEVQLANLHTKITDLIRTDVRTETLESAQFLATRMNELPKFIYVEELKKQFADRVASCVFEPEMKMASGYFAYHGLVTFKAGYSVEVQIYSALMSEWRRLSHVLYEQVRINPIEAHEFGSKESRLISLGHMLHLAECEIQRLTQEMVH